MRRVADGEEPDQRALHVLLTRVRHGAIGYRTGTGVVLDDGTTRAGHILALQLSLLESQRLVHRAPFTLGWHLVLLTELGREVLDRLDVEVFGEPTPPPADPSLPACERGEVA